MERHQLTHSLKEECDMGTSPETFDQVKNILRKLDRSITDARQRRLDTDDKHQPADNLSEQAKPGRARPMRPRPKGFRGDFNASPRF
jgi:hypothetical protein